MPTPRDPNVWPGNCGKGDARDPLGVSPRNNRPAPAHQPDALDRYFDGEIGRLSQPMLDALRAQPQLRPQLDDTRKLVADLGRAPQCPDFSASILARVEAQRPFLETRQRWLVRGARLAVAAAVLLAVGAAVVVGRQQVGPQTDDDLAQAPITRLERAAVVDSVQTVNELKALTNAAERPMLAGVTVMPPSAAPLSLAGLSDLRVTGVRMVHVSGVSTSSVSGGPGLATPALAAAGGQPGRVEVGGVQVGAVARVSPGAGMPMLGGVESAYLPVASGPFDPVMPAELNAGLGGVAGVWASSRIPR